MLSDFKGVDLETVLRGAKPEDKPGGWKDQDVKRTLDKLKEVEIDTTQKLVQSLQKGNLNARLKQCNLKGFTPDTLMDLRQYLGVEVKFKAQPSSRDASILTSVPPEATQAPVALASTTAASALEAEMRAAGSAPKPAPKPAPKSAPAPRASRETGRTPRSGTGAGAGASPPSREDPPLSAFAPTPAPKRASSPRGRPRSTAGAEARPAVGGRRSRSRSSSEESDEVMLASEVKSSSLRELALTNDNKGWSNYMEWRMNADNQDEEEAEDAIPDLRTLLKHLPPTEEENEAELERARGLGIDADRLVDRTMVIALTTDVKRLEELTLQELIKRCEKMGVAACSLCPRDGLRRVLKESLIWDELNVPALIEECKMRKLDAKGRSRGQLITLLKESTWEAVGVPIKQFGSRDEARKVLLELRREANFSPEKLEERAKGYDLPASLSQELRLEWLKQIIVWKRLPLSELRKECLREGLDPKEEPPKEPEKALSAYLSHLLTAKRKRRCQAGGVKPENFGGLTEAEALMQEFERQERLDVVALRAEVAKIADADVPVLDGGEEEVAKKAALKQQKAQVEQKLQELRKSKQVMLEAEDYEGAHDVKCKEKELQAKLKSLEDGTEEEKAFLLKLLRDIQMWSREPIDSLKGECRKRQIAFPEVFSANGGIPEELWIAGSWTNFQPVSMTKVGKQFKINLAIGDDGQDNFQLLLDQDWEKTLYPSVADANPYVPHYVLGPNGRGHGKNWSIGTHSNDADFSKPGAKCTVKVSFDDDLPIVSWDSGLPVAGILQRPSTASTSTPQRPQAVAPRSFKGNDRRERLERMEPAKKQAIKALAERQVLLRSLAVDGVPVRWFEGEELKKLLDNCMDAEDCDQDELLTWYKDSGFPLEEELDRKEILRFFKCVRAWQTMPLPALREEWKKQKPSRSVIDEPPADDTEEEQRVYFVEKLVDQDRMKAWDRRGYEALQIGDLDTVVGIIIELERLKALPPEELQEQWTAAGLPEEELAESSERVFATLKKLLVWSNIDLPLLQDECRRADLPIDADGAKGQTDEQLRSSLMTQLRVVRFRKLYEARGLPVKKLGALKTWEVVASIERFKAMNDEELRVAYEGKQKFLPPNTPRKLLLDFLTDVTVWDVLSTENLLEVAKESGIPMPGFQFEKEELHKRGSEEDSFVAKLREDLADRLILRTHLVRARRSIDGDVDSAPRPRCTWPQQLQLPSLGDGSSQPALPEGGAEQEHHGGDGAVPADGPVDASQVPEVWRLIQKMRDPFICERIAGIERKELPKSAKLPPAARNWRPVEAAVHVLSNGKFDPATHGREAAPTDSGASPKGPLISVVCPTSDSRQHFHELLYECYKKQDYSHKELIVVDSGSRPSEFFKKKMLEDSSVVYRFFDVEDSREGQKHSKVAWSLGLKRNVACCLARGDILAHFDDDDLYSPGYLSWMRSVLRVPWDDANGQAKPVAAKLVDWYLLDIHDLSFRYLDVYNDSAVPCRERRGWLYGWGFSYVFTRSAWELAPVPDVEFAEDIAFLEGLMAADVKVHLARLPQGRIEKPGSLPQCLVAHSCHPGSTSGGEFDGRRRSGKPVNMREEVLQEVAPLKVLVQAIKQKQKGPLPPGGNQHLLLGHPARMNPAAFGAQNRFGKPGSTSFRIGGTGANGIFQHAQGYAYHSFGPAPTMKQRPGATPIAR